MFISGNIRLPKGAIQIRDNLYFPDYMNMRNSLKINSPFAWANEVHFLYEHAVEIGEMYISHWDFEVLHNAVWVNASSYFNYSIVSDEGDLNVYDIYLQFKTPLKLLPKLVLKGNVEMEETVYRGNFSTQTIDTAFSMAGSMEVLELKIFLRSHIYLILYFSRMKISLRQLLSCNWTHH